VELGPNQNDDAPGTAPPVDLHDPPEPPSELDGAPETTRPVEAESIPVAEIVPTGLASLSRTKKLQLGAAAAIVCFVFLVLLWLPRSKPGRIAVGPPGGIDSSFQPGTGADNEIRTVVLQPGGMILIGGRFATVDQFAVKGVARLRADGHADTNFAVSASGTVHAIAVQPDGKVVIGGDFVRVGASPRRRLARIEPDGTLDSGFDAKGAVNREVRALVIQPDGKIVVGGSFDGATGNKQNRLTRLNADGTQDGSFNPGAGANAAVFAVVLQPDGKLLAAGDFTRFANVPCGRIVRLKPNGSLDQEFKAGAGATAMVAGLWLQPDGKILISGNFNTIDNRKRNRIARLNADGSLDESFDPGAGPNSSIRSLALQPDGKIIVGGTFDQIGEAPRRGVARLTKEGGLDLSFDPGEGAGGIWCVTRQPDGKVLVAGSFTNFNNVACGRLVRLYGGAGKAAASR
jgi:uncharacterized delta-60 repeat protein